MEKIEPGKYVEMAYSLYEIDGDGGETLVYETEEKMPETIVFGVTQGVMEPLLKVLDGKKAGDTFEVVMTPEESFGGYDPERVVTLEKEIFEVDGKFDEEMVKVGAMLPMMDNMGNQLYGRVTAIGDKDVTMDFNHVLAGKNVKFAGKVLTVRDATPEEIHPAEGCGCGCGCEAEACADECGCHKGEKCSDGKCGC